jgi:hypothetical protein
MRRNGVINWLQRTVIALPAQTYCATWQAMVKVSMADLIQTKKPPNADKTYNAAPHLGRRFFDRVVNF